MSVYTPAESGHGRVAIVSGAASGIGAATAALLHRQGYTTIGVDVTRRGGPRMGPPPGRHR